jgi:hypothetical protein
LKVLGSADGDELDVTLAAMLGCVLGGTGSAAKQPGNKVQIAEKYRSEAIVKTPLPQIFVIDFCCCGLRGNDFILHFPFGFLPTAGVSVFCDFVH